MAPTKAVRHDLSRGLPTRKSKLSGHLWFCVFIKMNCMCLFSVYLLMLNKFCPSPSPSQFNFGSKLRFTTIVEMKTVIRIFCWSDKCTFVHSPDTSNMSSFTTSRRSALQMLPVGHNEFLHMQRLSFTLNCTRSNSASIVRLYQPFQKRFLCWTVSFAVFCFKNFPSQPQQILTHVPTASLSRGVQKCRCDRLIHH